ncbi:hypothetical protein RBU55_18345 [Pseudomonas chlororaphis subsp. aurantiaca]|uniref:putative adhesin n=1 Tax=Pseudomonas chlororaphis TaxID=587753 RepID=UPI0027DE6042|nr:hypothetical protein [Pseudomonas chlororaphis]WMI97527.1 hypothetical protein RBU55_18345 [Pseudomonas chlororaphis subsp. aurantiaca]
MCLITSKTPSTQSAAKPNAGATSDSQTVLKRAFKGISNSTAIKATSCRKVEAIELGENFYLFRGTSELPIKKLIIFAQGNASPGNGQIRLKNASLDFYCPDKQVLVNPDCTPIANKEIEASEKNPPGTAFNDYRLKKSSGDDRSHAFRTAQKTDCDVLVVRNRKTLSAFMKSYRLNLSDALQSLKTSGLAYDKIHCAFSRHSRSDPNPVLYKGFSEHEKPLDLPRPPYALE